MNVLNRVTLKNLIRNKTRTAVTIVGVILSVAMFTAVTSFVSSMQDFMIRSSIALDGDWEGKLSNIRYDSLSAVEDRAEATSSFLVQEEGYAVLEGGQNEDKPYLYIESLDDGAMENLPIRLISGRLPQNDTEILIPEHVFTNGGVELPVGSVLTLQVGRRQTEGETLGQHNPFLAEEESLDQLSEKTYTVVGWYQRPGFESYSAPGYTAVTRLNAASLSPDDTVSVYLRLKNVRAIYDILPGLAAASDAEGVEYNKDLLRCLGIDPNDNFNSVFYSMAAILILLIMAGSISLIYNAFAISVSERSRQFGMLSGAGATSRQIRHSVLLEALSISAVGVPLGVLSGIGGIGVTLYLLRDKIASTAGTVTGLTLDLAVSVPAVMAAVAVGLVTILLSAWIPARRAARMSAIDAIRQTNDVAIRSRQVRTSRLTRRLFGIEGELAMKNFKRNRRRYRTTVLSLVISIVLFLSASSFASYMTAGTDALAIASNYDLCFSGSYRPEDAAALLRQIAVLDEVSAVSSVDQFFGTVLTDPALVEQHQLEANQEQHGDNAHSLTEDGKAMLYVMVNAVNEEYMRGYLQRQGLSFDAYNDPDHPLALVIDRQKYMESDGRYTDSHLFRSQDLGEITVQDNFVEEGAAPQTVRLTAGAFVSEPPLGVYEAVSSPASFQLIVTDTVFKRVFAGFDPSPAEESAPALYIQSNDPSQAEQKIRDLLIAHHLNTSDLHNIFESKNAQDNFLLVVGVFAYGFITLISLITIANVFNTISTNINLRRREFAMLKSVGMTEKSFHRMMNFECLFYGLKSLLYSLPLALGVTVLIYLSISNEVNTPFLIPWGSLVFCVVCVFLIVFITMMYSMSKVRKENIIDALKNENL